MNPQKENPTSGQALAEPSKFKQSTTSLALFRKSVLAIVFFTKTINLMDVLLLAILLAVAVVSGYDVPTLAGGISDV